MVSKRTNLVTTDQVAGETTESVITAEIVEGGSPNNPHNSRIIKDDLDAITSHDDALAILAAHGILPVDAAELLADEWIPTAKDDLVNVAFIVVDTKTSWGDYGPFSTVRVVTRDGKKLRFSDGSTGIFEQLEHLKMKYGMKTAAGLTCQKGLVKSVYTRRDEEGQPLLNEKGVEEKGTTFYFNTARDGNQINA